MRIKQRMTAVAAWEHDAAEAVERAIATGCGTRPPGWWVYEAGRPDLAEGPVLAMDLFSHLHHPAGDPDPAAEARFRYLVGHGHLTPAELATIRTGTGARLAWRRRILEARS